MDKLTNRFGSLLDSAGQMYWELDRNFRVVFANELLKKNYGDPVGRVCHEFMTGLDCVCHDCPVSRVFLGEERASSERRRRTADGSIIWVQHTAIPIKDANGNISGASELMIDITDQKQTEDWLRDSESLYRGLVDQVPDIIFSLDADGRITFVNTQAEDFLGCPVREILEKPLKQYVVEQDHLLLESMFRIKRNQIWDEEVGVVDASGSRKFARIRCKGTFGDKERPNGFDGVLRDRTQRRLLEEELKSSKEALVEKIKIIDELYEHIVESGKCKAIEQHTAEVAHELRQPVAIVGGFARRLQKGFDSVSKDDPEEHKRYVEIMITEVQRLERILDRLIDYTARGRVILHFVDPNQLIEYILDMTHSRADQKRVRIEKNLGYEVGEIPVDPGRFQQLVLNLLSNAVEASPRDGVVTIETGASIPSDKAMKTGRLSTEIFFELKIRNDGITIPACDLEQVFNPFFTTKEQGIGLGLAVTRKIVEDHSGSISVRSDNRGTMFTVWLPMTTTSTEVSSRRAQSG